MRTTLLMAVLLGPGVLYAGTAMAVNQQKYKTAPQQDAPSWAKQCVSR
jgi:hypothetical protein